MAINFSGEFTTPRTQEEVFEFLSDPNQFAPLLPDFQSMSMQDATHFVVKVKVGVGNIRGSAEIKMELTEAVKPLRAHYKGQGTAVGSQVTVSASFDLVANGESTKVVWQGETGVFGKLASMAGGMLEPLGRKNIQKLIDGLQKALTVPAVQAPVQTMPGEPVPQSGNVPQSGIVDLAQATAFVPTDRDMPQSRTSDSSQSAGPQPGDVQAEPPGFGPKKTEPQQSGAAAPTENLDAEGDHGNGNQ